MFILIVSISLLTLLCYYNFYYKRKGLPPGPTPWPVFGNLLSLIQNPPAFWIGEIAVVSVTDYQTMIDTFQKDGEAYTGRFQFTKLRDMIRGGSYGLIFTEGDFWRDQRRFTLHTLRDFGLGKNLMQDKILEEISAMFQKIDCEIHANDEVNLAKIFDISVGSIINSDKAQEFYELKAIIKEQMKNNMHFFMFLLAANPEFFKKLPYLKDFYMEFKQNNDYLMNFFDKRIQDHHSYEEDIKDNPTDFVGAYLAEMERQNKIHPDGQHNYTLEQLKNVCADLWIAGQETTSNTLAWSVAFVIQHENVMDKICNEMDRIINCDRLITVADRSALPYMGAVINECQRMSNLLPINTLRRTMKDVNIGGYFLPTGTCIVPNVSVLMVDDNIFENPKKFNPERFLNENGELIKSPELMPFSLGKRQCLGESLARMELFLFLANLFNQYKLTVGQETPSLKRSSGATVTCPPFTCNVQKRFG